MSSNSGDNDDGNGSKRLSDSAFESFFALHALDLKQFALHALDLKQKASALANDLEALTDVVTQDVGRGFKGKVREFEIGLIKFALMQAGGNQARAAKLLDLNTSTLNDKIKRYGISTELRD